MEGHDINSGFTRKKTMTCWDSQNHFDIDRSARSPFQSILIFEHLNISIAVFSPKSSQIGVHCSANPMEAVKSIRTRLLSLARRSRDPHFAFSASLSTVALIGPFPLPSVLSPPPDAPMPSSASPFSGSGGGTAFPERSTPDDAADLQAMLAQLC